MIDKVTKENLQFILKAYELSLVTREKNISMYEAEAKKEHIALGGTLYNAAEIQSEISMQRGIPGKLHYLIDHFEEIQKILDKQLGKSSA